MRRLIPLLFLVAAALRGQQLDVDHLAAKTVADWKLPGLAIAVVQNDRVVYLKGFGEATPDSLFELGSTTKAFTTTAMAMLVDADKMAWDDPVRKYLDYFHVDDPCTDSLITLRDIVSHHSGLARHDELWDNTPYTREEIIRRLGRLPVDAPIRAKYEYNNILFAAAGEAVASAAKTSWEDFIRTHIFQPLGMAHSAITMAEWNAVPHLGGHRWDRARGQAVPQTMNDYANIAPAGTIKTTARDMAQWLRFQLAGGVIDGRRLVAQAALDETKSPQTIILITDKSAPETNFATYGMGWNVSDYRGTLLVSHGGALNGFRSQVALLPKQNAGVVLLTNVGRGYSIIALRNSILDQILNASPPRDWSAYFMDIEAKADAAADVAKRERAEKRHANTQPSRALAAYAGTYTNAGMGDAVISLDHDQLVLHWLRFTIPLQHYHYDTFTATSEADDIDQQVEFLLDPAGNVAKLTLYGVTWEKK